MSASGKYRGNVVLQEEQDLGLALMMSLDSTQRKAATTGHKKGVNMQVDANQDNNDHQAPIGVSSPSGSRAATRNHIHTIIRTPNGNDYGKDLLKRHLETHHH
jgi:hypothetical protein